MILKERNKMDVYDRYRESPQGCKPVAVTLVIVALLFLAMCATSCRSVKTTTIEKVNYRDSIITHVVNDTNRVTITDTIKVEVHTSKQTENGTQITFGAGGGTYNSKTGEATNVIGVTESSKSTEQRDSIADMKHQLDAYQAKCDSLTKRVIAYAKDYQQASEKSGRSGYDRFCSWWFWITAILLLVKVACWVMEKIPTTEPYIKTIRRFVPFL